LVAACPSLESVKVVIPDVGFVSEDFFKGLLIL
jgi:hypothetical protein